jgi:hypothetical protein
MELIDILIGSVLALIMFGIGSSLKAFGFQRDLQSSQGINPGAGLANDLSSHYVFHYCPTYLHFHLNSK